jgi:hypothetical protein
MKKRDFLLALALIFALTLAGGAIAQADTALTLGASPAIVTYPHRSTLTVGFPASDPATATLFAMPAGASEWTTLTLTATTATPTVSVKPRVTTAYKASLDGVESDPVTVTVRALLSKPQLPGSVRRNRTVTVKGSMQPVGEAGAVVTVKIYKLVTIYTRIGKGHLKRSTDWALFETLTVPLKAKPHSTVTRYWSFRWAPSELGQYRIVVSHEDLGHAYSQKTAFTRVRR